MNGCNSFPMCPLRFLLHVLTVVTLKTINVCLVARSSLKWFVWSLASPLILPHTGSLGYSILACLQLRYLWGRKNVAFNLSVRTRELSLQVQRLPTGRSKLSEARNYSAVVDLSWEVQIVWLALVRPSHKILLNSCSGHGVLSDLYLMYSPLHRLLERGLRVWLSDNYVWPVCLCVYKTGCRNPLYVSVEIVFAGRSIINIISWNFYLISTSLHKNLLL